MRSWQSEELGGFKVSGQALYGDILALAACALMTGQHARKRHSLSVYTFIVYGISASAC
ncbi:hypothetical protein [Bacillus swezeyi]|uniref:hypothetical protein n=1 Tax=Bacillus swezeyi TaxID=1925020 RepID=UPI0039C60C89